MSFFMQAVTWMNL